MKMKDEIFETEHKTTWATDKDSRMVGFDNLDC